MLILSEVLYLVHVIALVLAAGSATIKMLLLFKCNRDYSFFPTFFQVGPMITRLIVMGMILLTISGITWIIIGYSVNMLLAIKIVVVTGIWILGPMIDNIAEPKVRKYLPAQEQTPSAEFIRAQKQHLRLEIAATVLMYAALVIGVLL